MWARRRSSGLFVVLTITVTAPRIGVASVDRTPDRGTARDGRRDRPLRLFGVDKVPLGAVRLLGIALLAAGTALVLRK